MKTREIVKFATSLERAALLAVLLGEEASIQIVRRGYGHIYRVVAPAK